MPGRATKTLLGEEARKAIFAGVMAIYRPVSLTFGPQGRNALLFRTYNRGSRIANDGYTVSECQVPKDPHIRLASEAFKEGCKRTNEKVGDGTTGTVVVGGVLMQDVYRALSENSSKFVAKTGGIGVMALKKKILESAEKVKKAIKESAVEIKSLEDLEKIAIVSVEDVELGKTIAKMAWEVGVDGFIEVTEGYKGEIETEIIQGFRFAAKIAAKVFVNNPARYEMVAEDCPVLVTNYALDNATELGNVFKNMNGSISKIIIVAPSFSEDTLINMVNATKNGFVMYPVAVPSLRTEQFEDLAIYCGAKFIDKNKGKILRNTQVTDLGFLGKLIVKDTEAREDAIATGGHGAIEAETSIVEKEDVVVGKQKQKQNKIVNRMTSPLKERITMLKGQIENTQGDQFKKLLEKRIGSMASAVGVIRVGDTTDASALWRKLKIEDAVYACKAALRGGSVKGGGLCLKEIADTLEDGDILKNALLAPYKQIQNSVEGGIEIGKDIIDPMESVYYAVEHATSIVANLATVEIITPEMEDPIHGEGEFAIARAMTELVVSDKIHKGQITASEEETWKDHFNGLSEDEMMSLDTG